MTWKKLVTVAAAVATFAAPVGAMGQTTAAAQKNAVHKGKKEADLPAAVRATVEAETKNATVKSISTEKENGKTVYEVESMVGNRTRDFMVDASGKVYEVEEQLDLAQAPGPVKAAIEAKGKVLQLEQVTTNGKIHYEGKAQTKAGKKVSFDLDAAGKSVKQ
jgi:uncharacterized membrane protein YkoI